MRATAPSSRADDRRSLLAAAGVILIVALAAWFAFNPALPFSRPFELRATVRSANQLHASSPVRIAGVDVGKVTHVEAGPGATSIVVMQIKAKGLPLHRDATLAIRPRLFLEGGFYVQLEPGSPSAPTLGSGQVVPLAQTTTPVQLYQLLSTFDGPLRGRLRTTFEQLSVGLADGGADGLRAAAPELSPALRNLAWITQAAQGTAPHDVSQAITAGARLTGALAADPVALGGLVEALATTTATLARRDRELGATVEQLDRVVRVAPSTLRALDNALPESRRAIGSLREALPGAPAALRRVDTVMTGLNDLVKPGARERTVSALGTTFRDLPTLVGRLAGLFPSAKPLTDCLRTHVVPVLGQEAPDGDLSTGRPVWQDFVHALTGLAGSSQNFDGNGYAARFMFGTGPDILSTESIPGLGKLVTSLGTSIRSRPKPLTPGTTPVLNPDAPCTAQPVPTLEAETGTSGLTSIGSARSAIRVSPANLVRSLGSTATRRTLRTAAP